MGAFVGSYRWFSLALSAVAILAARKAVAEPVLDRALAGTQIFTGKGCTILKVNFNLLYALEKLLKHSAFAGVGRDEIEDQAILLLAVPMNTAHALFEPHGIVHEEALAVATELGLPRWWLNEQASSYVAPGGDPAASRVFDHPGLRVFAASPEHLLAMVDGVDHHDLEEVLEVAVEELHQRLTQLRAGVARSGLECRDVVLGDPEAARELTLGQVMLVAHRPQSDRPDFDVHTDKYTHL